MDASTKWLYVYPLPTHKQRFVRLSSQLICLRAYFLNCTKKTFDKYHMSIDMNIKHLLEYVHTKKIGVKDLFLRRLKLIV